ncbi:hypothetical protein HSBAA_PA_0370 (plasmid) [Vreelandella sulfidaeris]|uniref:Uncharacterized protein n=1 Tax=Vreelandella sulfidaeris TaxID=115553 RepID=A0A455URB1_9GAMM|nr:hypothetical protein HSBAA_PA_0370 [Halomonas sulfidaeris]
MLYAASNDYQEAVQVQQQAREEYVASRSGSIPTPASPQTISAMRSDANDLRGEVEQRQNADHAEVAGRENAVSGSVGANTSDLGARAATATEVTTPIERWCKFTIG